MKQHMCTMLYNFGITIEYPATLTRRHLQPPGYLATYVHEVDIAMFCMFSEIPQTCLGADCLKARFVTTLPGKRRIATFIFWIVG